MHKILFTLLLLLSVFFSPSEVFAGVVPACATPPDAVQRGTADGKEAGGQVTCPRNDDTCYVRRAAGMFVYDCYGKTAVTAAPNPVANPGAPAAAPETVADPCANGGSGCTSARGIPCPGGGIETAIGCVPTEPRALIEGILKFGTMAAGGVAFLIMLLAALEMITAEGNPQSIKGAQEKFYSAIIGLLLIIFSVLLMQVIGVDILDLPGFGK